METLRGDKAALGFAAGRFFHVTISGPPAGAGSDRAVSPRGLREMRMSQAPRPQPVEPDAEYAIGQAEPRTAGPLASQNGQLIAEGDDFEFQCRPAAKSAQEQRNNRANQSDHADHGTAPIRKTLAFASHIEF